MSAVVIVPAYGLEGVRAANCDRVLAHLRSQGFRTLCVSPRDPTQFSRSSVRNLGAELAALEPSPASVLVFNDADSLVPGPQITRAAAWAESEPGLVYAYDLYLRLDADGRIEQELFTPPSMGCVAIRADCFEELGGFDPGFRGWGYEDLEFATRSARRWPIRRVPGVLEHLWHGDRRPDDSPADEDVEQVSANRKRWIEATRLETPA